ncbi:SDR family oxidoreductase [Acinetobacter qingfengensis]|uniref:Oxidoreductase n=1 Tax=Acinetobacter qingfengensis TaxID=1262585 RepID=A0A1E7RF68_9GAMM|nr:SDR family oxidoreductase [Acinetobacter qingfengensis]KAA8731863.1 SDR family oxidoreductase [Acinetobacter qingfengensis]OEY98014.1 oxidoreductase [Acinetobacter qingfengensis]
MNSIQQKCVVITGSTRGIGLGLAKAFLNLGWSVVISARNSERLQHTMAQLAAQFDDRILAGYCCDMTQKSQVQQLWNTSVQQFGHIDVWINNAGSCHPTTAFADLSSEELYQVINTNILGTMLGSQVALQGMLQQGYGQIFNMEGWGSRGEWSAGMTAYSTTKRAVSYFSQGLYKENKHGKILIGTLSPGMVATDLLISSWKNGNHENWRRMKRLFNFVIDPPDVVCTYLAQQIHHNQKNNRRIVWMTPWRLLLRFFQPYYWRRNAVKGTALDDL